MYLKLMIKYIQNHWDRLMAKVKSDQVLALVKVGLLGVACRICWGLGDPHS